MSINDKMHINTIYIRGRATSLEKGGLDEGEGRPKLSQSSVLTPKTTRQYMETVGEIQFFLNDRNGLEDETKDFYKSNRISFYVFYAIF